MYCNKCGSEILTGAKFCVKCGQAVKNASTKSQNEIGTIRCKCCGAKISRTADSCVHCGAKTPGRMLADCVKGVGCGLLAVPVILTLIAFYVFLFIILF